MSPHPKRPREGEQESEEASIDAKIRDWIMQDDAKVTNIPVELLPYQQQVLDLLKQKLLQEERIKDIRESILDIQEKNKIKDLRIKNKEKKIQIYDFIENLHVSEDVQNCLITELSKLPRPQFDCLVLNKPNEHYKYSVLKEVLKNAGLGAEGINVSALGVEKSHIDPLLMHSPSDLKNRWHDGELGFHFCRPMDNFGIPITLKSKNIAYFVNLYEKDEYENLNKFFPSAVNLCITMSNMYRNESDRHRALFEVLKKAFPSMNQELVLEVSGYRIENSVANSDGMPVLLGKIKNEISTGEGCMIVEAMTFYRHAINRSKTTAGCLLFASMGSLGAIYGLSNCSGNVLCELLVPWRHFSFTTIDYTGLIHVAKVLSLTEQFIYSNFDNDISGDRFPYFRSFLQRDFTYRNQIHHEKLLFRIELDDKSNAIIKFTKKYHLESHRVLAEAGFAPKIIHYEELLAGWKVIIMEDVSDYYDHVLELSDLAKKKLRLAIETVLHAKNYVHGDIRNSNILVNKDQSICILDFDWAGKMGQARYPITINTDENMWHSGVRPGGLIEKEHDLYYCHE